MKKQKCNKNYHNKEIPNNAIQLHNYHRTLKNIDYEKYILKIMWTVWKFEILYQVQTGT